MALKYVFAAMLLSQAIAIPAQTTKPAPPPPPLLSHEVHADRSVTFRFNDDTAKHVELNLEGVAKPVPMVKGEGGIWSYTTGSLAPEIYFYYFLVDGVQRIDSENHWIAENLVFPASSILVVKGETPQPWEETDVPHGTLHTHRFTSKVAIGLPANQEEVVIYTPPGYDPHAAKPYPVLYLMHGFSGVAEGWTKDQQANFILDNLLAAGRIKPMVVVMPLAYGDWSLLKNDFPWNDSAAAAAVLDHNTQLFMSMLTGEIMPMAESAYNIARDREGRAIAGLSMGGLESLEIGLLNPDKFAWIGGFSSGVSFLDYGHKLGALDAKTADLKLLWIACGTEDSLIEANRKMIAFLKAKGMPVTQVETPGLHVSLVWRDNLIHFTPLLFQK